MQNLNKIEKIFRMLGSPNDHECLNALNAIKGILTAQNKNFSDLSNHLFNGQPQTRANDYKRNSDWQERYEQHNKSRFYDDTGERQEYDYSELVMMANLLMNKMADFPLSNWERDFIMSIMQKRLKHQMTLSAKQASVLVKIYRQHTGKDRP